MLREASAVVTGGAAPYLVSKEAIAVFSRMAAEEVREGRGLRVALTIASTSPPGSISHRAWCGIGLREYSDQFVSLAKKPLLLAGLAGWGGALGESR